VTKPSRGKLSSNDIEHSGMIMKGLSFAALATPLSQDPISFQDIRRSVVVVEMMATAEKGKGPRQT
jgi:hypothetical protein